jgi:hypothetical protein
LVILLEVQVEAWNDQIFATSDRLDLPARLERSRQNLSGQKLTARYSVPENPERLVYAYQSAGRSTKASMLGVASCRAAATPIYLNDKPLGPLPAIVIHVTDHSRG